MTNKHPYVQAPKHLSECIARFRRSLPTTVNAETLKKLGIASNNERYVIGTFRFLELIDEEGKTTDEARKLFSQADDGAFQEQLSIVVRSHYSDLFELHGDNAWTLSRVELATYFRNADQTSEIVGSRQSMTFRILSDFCGHSDTQARGAAEGMPRADRSTKKTTSRKSSNTRTKAIHKKNEAGPSVPADENRKSINLTVRIEVNLPAGGDRDTYDNIFQSIRDNLIDA